MLKRHGIKCRQNHRNTKPPLTPISYIEKENKQTLIPNTAIPLSPTQIQEDEDEEGPL